MDLWRPLESCSDTNPRFTVAWKKSFSDSEADASFVNKIQDRFLVTLENNKFFEIIIHAQNQPDTKYHPVNRFLQDFEPWSDLGENEVKIKSYSVCREYASKVQTESAEVSILSVTSRVKFHSPNHLGRTRGRKIENGQSTRKGKRSNQND